MLLPAKCSEKTKSEVFYSSRLNQPGGAVASGTGARIGDEGKTMVEKFTRKTQPLSAEQKQKFDTVRQRAQEEFPPLTPPQGPSAQGRIAPAIRAARVKQGLTFEQLAQRAGLAGGETVRDIEYGSDAKISDVTAIAAALGLSLELVPQQS
jgi:ribosome-binding protein aMBF1 (putative translation factor)